MQRMRISIDNIALFFALMLALAMGMVPVLAYAGDPGPQKIAPQSAIASADNNETNETAVFTSFRSFGEGCEWALDASGALTVRAADGVSGTLPSGTWPWADAIGQITSVVFEPGVKAGSSLSDILMAQ